MESDAGQPCSFQHPLEHMQHAVRGHRASGRRWEYPFAVPNFAFLHFQNAYRFCRQRQGAVGVFCFQRGFDHFAILPGNSPLDFQYATVKVYIRPFQSQQFSPPKSGSEVEVVELVHAAVSGLLEEGAELVGGQGFHLFVFHLRQGTALRWIFRDEALFHGEVVRRADHLVDISHRLGCQTFRLFLGFDAVYSPAVQQVLVESLQVQRSQLCQWNAADLRLDVVLEEALAGLEGGWAQLDFRVVFHPDLQPATHGVGLGPSIVDADIFLDGLFQFFFDLGLRLAKHVFDDGLAGFGIVTDSVPALPASVFALSDISLAVCSSFRHSIDLLCNGKPYRKQQRKATEKRNRYQKVII